MNTGERRRAISSQNGKNYGVCKYLPPTFEVMSAPTNPGSASARLSSAKAASIELKGMLANALKRSGLWRHDAANASLTMRHSSGLCSSTRIYMDGVDKISI